jgi:glycosyltransferase involved in cell wall biosynthesis
MRDDTNTERKGKILVICNYYLPGYKSGGSLRTIVNMVERLQDEFDFRIITLDHDGDRIPYSNVVIDNWNKVNGVEVFYLSQKSVNFSKIRKLVLEIAPDSIYLNSAFSTLTVILLTLRKLKLIPGIKIILAPEGELAAGALQLKAMKKKVFLNFAEIVGLYQNVIWKATGDSEKREVKKISASGSRIFIAPNMPPRGIFDEYRQSAKPEKNIGAARFVFLSRYMRTKNFNWLIEILPDIKGELAIDIYGPLEDENYWQESKKMIEKLPGNIKIEYRGALLHDEVAGKLFEYHFFILPTLGESFGHVILEALSAGCPLIISDRTPWLNLEEKGIGWDVPLEKPERWAEVINECISYSQEKYTGISSKARSFAVKWLTDPGVEEQTLKVLRESVSKA